MSFRYSYSIEDQFVKKPSENFFCPFTLKVLMEPYLTSCCGEHLSKEAATRIQGASGVCPFCKEPNWSTELNKSFRRQVHELQVFCPHRERGCQWVGELGALKHHEESCGNRPPVEEIAQLSL